jgi:hypothetical protein
MDESELISPWLELISPGLVPTLPQAPFKEPEDSRRIAHSALVYSIGTSSRPPTAAEIKPRRKSSIKRKKKSIQTLVAPQVAQVKPKEFKKMIWKSAGPAVIPKRSHFVKEKISVRDMSLMFPLVSKVSRPQLFCVSMPKDASGSKKIYISDIPDEMPPRLTADADQKIAEILRSSTLDESETPRELFSLRSLVDEPLPSRRSSITAPVFQRTLQRLSPNKARVLSAAIPFQKPRNAGLPVSGNTEASRARLQKQTAGSLPRDPSNEVSSPFPRIRVLLSVLPRASIAASTSKLSHFTQGAGKSAKLEKGIKKPLAMSSVQYQSDNVVHDYPFNVFCAKGVWQ